MNAYTQTQKKRGLSRWGGRDPRKGNSLEKGEQDDTKEGFVPLLASMRRKSAGRGLPRKKGMGKGRRKAA